MTVWLEIGGKKQRVELPSGGVGSGAMECVVDGRAMSVDLRMLEPGVMSLVVISPDGQGQQYRCVLDGDGVVIGGRRYGFEVEGSAVADRTTWGGRGNGGASTGEGSDARGAWCGCWWGWATRWWRGAGGGLAFRTTGMSMAVEHQIGSRDDRRLRPAENCPGRERFPKARP